MSEDGYFGAEVAQSYDRDHGGSDAETVARAVALLHRLAGDGAALEFAIGTGRIALPLAARGCLVKGIELSRAMVAELRKKETATALEVAIGDMTRTRIEGAFSLVYLVFNTIDNLITQEAQIACFENAARHLRAQGHFLIETQLPPIQKLAIGETKLAFACSDSHFGVDEIDIATQCYRSNHIWIEGGAHKHLSVPFRYVWPSELDLMARLAGLELVHRWGDWDATAFDNRSRKHISVWRKSR